MDADEFTPLTLVLAGTNKTREPMHLPQSRSKWAEETEAGAAKEIH